MSRAQVGDIVSKIKISETFKDKYPELSEKLNDLGIEKVSQLLDRLNTNPKYLTETLEYSVKDNEIIYSMSQKAVEDDLKSSDIKRQVYAAIMTAIILYMIYFFIQNGVI